MNNIKDFYSIVEKLKFTKRQGWLGRKLNSDSFGSHIFGSMSLGWFLADREKVDAQKVIQMLLIHDLVMAEMDDISPTIGQYSGQYESKKDMEQEVKQRIVAALPQNLSKSYLVLFDEYNNSKTPESVVANEANKLDTLLQAEVFEENTKRTDILDEFLETYKNVFSTKSGKKTYEDIKIRHLERKNNGKTG